MTSDTSTQEELSFPQRWMALKAALRELNETPLAFVEWYKLNSQEWLSGREAFIEFVNQQLVHATYWSVSLRGKIKVQIPGHGLTEVAVPYWLHAGAAYVNTNISRSAQDLADYLSGEVPTTIARWKATSAAMYQQYVVNWDTNL